VVDCGDCFVFQVDLIALKEKHASMCEELDVLRIELAELHSRPSLLCAYTSSPVLHEKLAELCSRIVSLEANLKAHIPTSCSTCELHDVKNLKLARWGIGQKTFHPQDVEVAEFVNIFMNLPQGGKFCFMTRKRS
jgi:hypothetical protein